MTSHPSSTQLRHPLPTCGLAANQHLGLRAEPLLRQVLVQRRVAVLFREAFLHDRWMAEEISSVDSAFRALLPQFESSQTVHSLTGHRKHGNSASPSMTSGESDDRMVEPVNSKVICGVRHVKRVEKIRETK